MKNVKILDCTLRDGGYINNWGFGFNNIKTIIDSLYRAGIDFIEYGFLTDCVFDSNYALYNAVSDITNFSEKKNDCTVMLNLGEVSVENIDVPLDLDVEIRIAFKKHQLNDLQKPLLILEEKGIKYSLNPMHTSIYNQNERELLFNLINSHNPVCVTVVDTMGIMDESDTEKIFKLFNERIRENIPLGFHSHNNLDKSISNINSLLDLNIDRELIIDSSLKGLGRGGGMPSTSNLIKLLGLNNYDIEIIKHLENTIIDQIINGSDIWDRKPYYLSALNKCHPNYALYLLRHIGKNYSIMQKMLAKIPEENKTIYSESVIRDMLSDEQSIVK